MAATMARPETIRIQKVDSVSGRVVEERQARYAVLKTQITVWWATSMKRVRFDLDGYRHPAPSRQWAPFWRIHPDDLAALK